MDRQKILKELYDKYGGRMLAVCMRYCGSRDLAKDMMQDGFVQVFNSLDKFTDRGEGSLRAWAERIMVNTCLQHLRKRDLLNESIELDYIKAENQLDDSSIDDMVEKIPQSALMAMIGELPVGYRTVFNLYVFEEKSHKEIGALLGINERSSSSQYYRAKCLLAKKIKEYEQRG